VAAILADGPGGEGSVGAIGTDDTMGGRAVAMLEDGWGRVLLSGAAFGEPLMRAAAEEMGGGGVACV